jgi:stage IV sporulation protein FB
VVDRLAALNLFLTLFNLIPAFPMDGGRALRATLASRTGFVRATERVASTSQFTAFVPGFFGLFHNPILVFIAVFVYPAAASETHSVALRAASRGVPVSQAMMSHFVPLQPDARIGETTNVLFCGPRRGRFPCSTATEVSSAPPIAPTSFRL